jgi:hypothetical protein
VLSPREVELETIGLGRYFRGDCGSLAGRCSEPLRAVSVDARRHRELSGARPLAVAAMRASDRPGATVLVPPKPADAA